MEVIDLLVFIPIKILIEPPTRNCGLGLIMK